jgi:tetratricopeptide (TPR) repeat protein
MTRDCRLWHRRALILLACLLGMGFVSARGQDADDFDALDRRAEQLFYAGKYPEATDVQKRALTLAERQFGPDHLNVAKALVGLGGIFYCQGRTAEAGPLLERGRAILEKATGVDSLMVTTLDYLAAVYEVQGRNAEAAPLRQRARVIEQNARAR